MSRIEWARRVRVLGFRLGVLVFALLVVAGTDEARSENVILFIGDGMGPEQVLAARYYNGVPLSFENLPVTADCTTYSADNSVTDSAAAGTAIATGVKVNNGVISLAIPGNGNELETILEFYQKRGKKVGLITTAYPTHATPAAFGAHDSSRSNETQIGQDLLNQTLPNILFGGGGHGLDPASAIAAGYAVATTTAEFGGLSPSGDYLCALFGDGYMPYEEDYLLGNYPYPHLTDMVVKAMAALESHPDGFFLMVEAGRIDHAGHANLLPENVHETLELSRAVQAALNWASVAGRPDTTILVTADHETGGLDVTTDNGPGNYPTVTWSTTGHTGVNVPVYAWGRNAQLVEGTLDNTDFFNLFTAESTTSPVLSRVAADVIDETTVAITWSTDVPSDSMVEYLRESEVDWTQVSDSALVTEHAILLTGLAPDALYAYRVSSHDGTTLGTSAAYSFTPTSGLEPGVLVAAGSHWKYDDTGTDLGTLWRGTSYNDTAWASGPAELGYGDGGEATVISYGSDPGNKYPCYYFRHTVTVQDPAALASLHLSVLRDDGCVVYLNGQEVARYNMPAGAISYTTYASSASEYSWDAAVEIPNLLVAGDNVIAVEVHQGNASSSDLSFDLELLGDTAISLTLDAPADGATGVAVPATLAATAVHPQDEPMRVGFYGRQAPVAADEFTIVVLPDTQMYSQSYPHIFTAQTQWIVDTAAALNTVFVCHEGDVVETYNSETEWQRANTSMSILDAAGIPYSLVPGNHDVPTTLYNQTFPYTRYSENSWFGGNSPVGMYDNNYHRFTAGGVDFLVLSLEPNPGSGSDAIGWANGVLAAHPNHHAILVTHGFINTDGSRVLNVFGDVTYLWTEVVVPNPNLNLVLCGHMHGEFTRTDVIEDASGVRQVHQLLADYQSLANGGDGWLRVMEFAPAYNEIQVSTYSPTRDEFQVDADSEFSLYYDMGGTSFATIQETDGVASGTQVEAVWDGLADATEYEWYVVASDDSEIQSSIPRRFTTGNGVPPAAPTGLQAAAVSSSRIDLSWADQSNNESGFEIEQATDGETFTPVMTAAANATGAQIDGLLAETTYWYQVRAVNGAGESAFAGPVSATTPAAPPPNVPPVADAQEVETDEDTFVAISLGATDPDGGPAALVFEIVEGPAHGGLGPLAGDVVVYTPEADYYGADGFTFRVYDGEDYSAPAAVTITVSPVNDAPVAADDAAVTLEGMAVSIPVLDNDTDADNDLLSVSAVSTPSNGSATIDPNGASVTYRPNPGFSGTDTFTYDLTDGIASATASVVVTVNRAVLFYDGFESGGLVAGGWSDVQSIAEVITAAAHDGTYGLQIKKAGSLTKVLNTGGATQLQIRYWRRTIGLAASEALTVEMSQDGGAWSPIEQVSGSSDWIELTHDLDLQDGVSTVALRFRLNGNGGNDIAYLDEIEVTGGTPNSPPIAVADTYEVSEDGTLTVDAASGVLANDTDAEGNSLYAVLVQDVASGVLDLQSTGSFTYTPAPDANGVFTFTYAASDGVAASDPAAVTITVTPVIDPPVAQSDSLTTDEDSPLTGTVPASDADGDALTLTVVSGPSNGILSPDGGTSFTYTPAVNFNGADSFVYTVYDGQAYSAEATITITVSPVNDAPAAVEDSATTDEDTPVTIGVLANDTDVEVDALSVASVSAPAHGSVEIAPDGSAVTYTPGADFNGSDGFTYTASDGQAESNPATVTITVTPVNDAPVARDDGAATPQDTAVLIDVLANDTDVDGPALTVTIASGPTSGTAASDGGAITYTPSPGFTGTDSLTYTLSDGDLSDVATVTIEVTRVNNSPVAADDAYTVAEDEVLAIAAPGVLGNDSDVDSDPLTAMLVSGPSNGSLTLNADGSFTYTPAADFAGTDSFTYTANDDLVASDPATVTITVNQMNDAPVAVADSVTTDEDTPATGNVLTNDTDADNDPLTAVLATGSSNGSLTLNANGSFTYTPDLDFAGTDSFTYTANDGTADSSVATVTIAVTAVNDAPVAGDDTVSTDEDTVVSGNVLANDGDVDSVALTASLVSGPSNGSLILNANGSFTYTPAADFHGTDGFTYTAHDEYAASELATVTITVNPVNDAPVAGDDTFSTDEDTMFSGNVLANDSDVDSVALTASLVSGPSNGSLTLNADGSFTYTPAVGFTGTDGFTYTVSDGQGGTATAIVTITVNPVASTSDMIVSGIAMDLISAGKNWKASATVTVTTAQGQPVPNATVTAEWYLGEALIGSTTSGVTDGQGRVTLVSVPEKAKAGDTFLIRITGVTADGYEYSAEGSVTTEAITVP